MSTFTIEDFRQVKKLLTLAAGTSDAEALAAFRKATEIIRKANLTWAGILDKQVSVVDPTGLSTSSPDEDLDDETFERALDGAGRDLRRTLLSIQAQWEKGASLTERQKAVVISAADRDRA